MTPEIVSRNVLIVVGMRAVFTPEASAMEGLWRERFMPRKTELSGLDRSFYCVFSPLPGDSRKRYEYVAGVLTGTLETIPNGMVGWVIPSGKYAAVKATGLGGVHQACQKLVTEWLPSSGYRQVANPFFATSADPNPESAAAAWTVNIPIESAEFLSQLERWMG